MISHCFQVAPDSLGEGMVRVGPLVSDKAEVEAAVRLYIESWYRGDADGMDRSLHDRLVKRAADPSDVTGLREVTKGRMVDLTAAGGGQDPSAAVEIVVHHVEGDIASAHVATPHYLDLIHVARTPGGWRIVNDLFRSRS